jgi:hypothetical protein
VRKQGEGRTLNVLLSLQHRRVQRLVEVSDLRAVGVSLSLRAFGLVDTGARTCSLCDMTLMEEMSSTSAGLLALSCFSWYSLSCLRSSSALAAAGLPLFFLSFFF